MWSSCAARALAERLGGNRKRGQQNEQENFLDHRHDLSVWGAILYDSRYQARAWERTNCEAPASLVRSVPAILRFRKLTRKTPGWSLAIPTPRAASPITTGQCRSERWPLP